MKISQLLIYSYCILCLQSINISQSEGSIRCGETVIGNTQTGGDVKYYRFSLNSTVPEVTLSACGSAFDTILYIYSFRNDTYSYLIDECDDCGDCAKSSSHSVWTEYDMNPGDYMVGIGGFSTYYGDYIFSISCFNHTTNGTMELMPIHLQNIDEREIKCNHIVSGSFTSDSMLYRYYKLSVHTSIAEISISSCESDLDSIVLRIYSFPANDSHMASTMLYDVCLFCGDCVSNSKQSIWVTNNIPIGNYLIEVISDSVGDYILNTECSNVEIAESSNIIQWNIISHMILPEPLSFHIMGYYNHRIVIIGGLNFNEYNSIIYDLTESTYISSVYYCDNFQIENVLTSSPDKHIWNILNVSTSNIRIHCHSDCSVQINELIYIVPYDEYCLSQTMLFIYNISSLSFADVADYNPNIASYLSTGNECNKICITTNTTHLFIIGVYEIVIYDIVMDEYTRFEHTKDIEGSACGYYDHYIYLFGGIDASGQYTFTRVYRYDTRLNTASQTMHIFEMDLPIDQTDARCITTPDHFMVSFGGYCTNADCKYFGSIWDSNTETIFRNVMIEGFGGYGSGYIYDEETNIIIRSGGIYTDMFGYLDLNNISTQIKFNITSNTIVPGDHIYFDYSVQLPKLSPSFVSYPLMFSLYSKELNIYSEIRINDMNNSCSICSVNCFKCSYGLFVPITSLNMMNKHYDITISSVSSGVSLNPPNIDQINTIYVTTCPPGHGAKIDSSVIDCNECDFNTFSLSYTQNECIKCGDNVNSVICQGSDNVIIGYNHWLYALHNTNEIIPFQDITKTDSMHSVVCPPHFCCLNQMGCNYVHDQDILCANGRDYQSLLCSSCISDYYELFGSNDCGKCDNQSNIPLLLIPLFFSVLFVIYIVYFDSTPMNIPDISISQIQYKTFVVKDNIIALQTLFFKILLYYYQSILQILFARGITSYLFPILSFFNFSTFIVTNSEGSGFCVIPFLKPLTKILSYLIGPSFLLLNFLIIYISFLLCNLRRARYLNYFCYNKVFKLFAKWKPYFGAAIFRILLICIGSVLSTCFQLLTCIELAHGQTVHFYDANRYCYDGYWIISFLFICLIMIIFCVIFYMIWKQNDEQRQSPENVFRKFINSFTTNYWFWEFVLFSRRFIIALFAAIQFVGGGVSNFIFTFLLCIYTVFHIKTNPFLYSRVNNMESLCLCCLILIFICINFMDISDTFIAVFIFCSILLPVLIFIYYLVQTIMLYHRSKTLDKDLSKSDIRVIKMVKRMPVSIRNVLIEKNSYSKVELEMQHTLNE